MALNIKDPATDRLARELAAMTGESITVALRTAVEERMRRVRGPAQVESAAEVGRDVIARGRARRGQAGPADVVIDYDEHGLPR